MDPESLSYIINHLFLPPKLPQADDSALRLQRDLLEHLSACAGAFCEGLEREGVAKEVQTRWAILRQMLACFASLHSVANIARESLEAAINRMQHDDVLCMHIVAQNAGVILRRRKADLAVEFFQASPSAASVTGTKGKLIIQYPSRPRLSLPIHTAFVTSLSALLADLDCTDMPDAIPKTQKAGSVQSELRDVRDIRYISELLGGIARGLTPIATAAEITSSTVYATKRINDHVLWQAALLPWHRAPKWLIARVALQTTLAQWKIEEKYGYKAFVTFVLARTLELAAAVDVHHELLFIMNTKLATRMWKLRSIFDADLPLATCPPFPVHFISDRIKSVGAMLHKRWEDFQERDAQASTWTVPTPAEITAAQDFTLPRSSAHFQAVKTRESVLNTQHTVFRPSVFEQQLQSTSERPAVLPYGFCTPDLWLAVLDLEEWIARWKDTTAPDQLSTLANLIEEHEKLASSFKSSNPEIFSRIFLAVLELWVALDKATTARFPLLLDYSPELSISSFEPLLLPELSQMRRLHNVELHLTNRRAKARYPYLSLFQIHTDPSSLPSRYFDDSRRLQEQWNNILKRAYNEKNQKIQELELKNRRHAELLEEKDRLEHEHIHDFRTDLRGRAVPIEITTNCSRCSIEKEIASLTIVSFEWPLPEDDILSRLVVFELSVPLPFGIWRDATYRLARTHSNINPKKNPTPNPVLRKYTPLHDRYVAHNPKQRITIASTAKSFLDSHYKKHSFPCADSDVILNHPLRYQFWDAIASEWLPFEFPIIDIREYCTPEFPSGPYRSLTWTAVSTTHTPNAVIARQSECSADLSYHEWEAFGHLRAGVRLQWRNIMLQVITGAVNLADPVVHLLFQQAAWQAEAALDDQALGHYREAHFDLSQEDFGLEIVDALYKRLETISENWKEGWTAATLGVIACRLFSLNEFESVKTSVFAFLSYLRQILFGWMKQVLTLLKTSGSADLVSRVLQLAASCRSTYAVGSAGLFQTFNNPEAVSIFIQCAIALNSNAPTSVQDASPPLRYLLQRDTLISAEAFSHLVGAISRSGDGIDAAIQGVWHGFDRHAKRWRKVGKRWMMCETLGSPHRQMRAIYLNLLDGSMLVDGRAQGTLPKEITRHPMYRTLFPNRATMDIIPSTMKGMEYQSRENVDGFEVHFKLIRDELLIRTRNGFNFVSEFIPLKQLQGDIPTHLLIGMVHIFHEQTQSMDIYPAPSGWQPLARAAWRLNLSPQGPRTLLKLTDDNVAEAVLDPVSSLVEKIAEIFRPLETNRTNLTIYSRFGRLHVSLPRYNLEFSVSSGGLLESKELPGFYVSLSQTIGTLIGLQSKLVLKSQKSEMTKVFIPEGKVIGLYGGDHPKVTISPSVTSHHIKTFSYDIDDIMGRVVRDGSLTSWYRLAYLHIATTSYLRDPLIHRTGIQQAQEMLGSAQSFAFMDLKQEHNDLLQQILDLAPIRKYYPEHLKTMETIQWLDILPPLTQCGGFVPLANAIVSYARKQATFRAPRHQSIVMPNYEGERNLRERAEFRTSRLVSNVCADESDVSVLPSRCLNCPSSNDREQAVAEAVALVHQWPTLVKVEVDLWAQFKNWNFFSSQPMKQNTIDNPRAWLKEPPSTVWFSLLSLCRSASKAMDQYGLVVAFGILAYRRDIDPRLSIPLLAIATTPTARTAAQSIPMETFNLAAGHTVALNDVVGIVAENCKSFENSRDWLHLFGLSHTRAAFHEQKKLQCEKLAGRIFAHWPGPCPALATLTTAHYPIVKFAQLQRGLDGLFSSRARNRRLFDSILLLQSKFNSGRRNQVQLCPSPVARDAVVKPSRKFMQMQFTLSSLLRESDVPQSLSHAPMQEARRSHSIETIPSRQYPPRASLSRELLGRLTETELKGPALQYMHDLSRCVDALEWQGSPKSDDAPNASHDIDAVNAAIQQSLRPQTLCESLLHETGQWPSTGPESLARQLSCETRHSLLPAWKAALIMYAEELARKQHHRRVKLFSQSGQEAETCGSRSWDASVYPDWFLFQLDADLLIRPMQASIAEQMMWPESNKNALMQLNMGEGKSSVIVPIVSLALAKGEQLVRVVVLKPLSAQMFQLLKQRVCGLANRRLFFLPFSRDTQLDCAKIQQIVALLKECVRVRGILLCQPEHILSFQLMGLHAFCQTKSIEESRLLIEAQEWLDTAARDILDESDEILNVRYQLIYTVGASRPLEGQPWRWNIIQEVFSLLQEIAQRDPDGLDVSQVGRGRCRFPITRILTDKGCQTLLESIVKRIVFYDHLRRWITFRNYSNAQKEFVCHFLWTTEINPQETAALKRFSPDCFGQLLLLRGLIAFGILKLALQEKRWRVDYGLDPSRSMLAVPYRAKDSPAPRAEFGHPDMIVALTCLSYYYSGLTDDQLDTIFVHLAQSDNPEQHYEDWVKRAVSLPANLASLRGLNLDDLEQKTCHIFPLLRYNKAAIDFYLSECVFPKEAREYPHKLTTNAWDLARTKARLTTGFSGTNDNKYLLPLSIEQLDQDSQQHTNAQVLEYILQPENRKVLCTNSDDALGLLYRVVQQQPSVMVLLDVGAQVLELRNEEVAREWLELDSRPHVEAAVYFDPSTDEIRVISRDGRIQPLASSLYNTQLEKTLVYLDEAHTRGTDFKFPTGSRAVVTLGPKLTKDKLVQGCMRMRRLGKDHSVLFFASAEIWSKIQITTHAQDLDSSHVLLWTMQETCTQIRDNGSLWANQGLNFDVRHTALKQHRAHPSSRGLVAALRERESHTLEELYGVNSNSGSEDKTAAQSWRQTAIRKKCQELGIDPTGKDLCEEQERELAHEKETEREAERILNAKPLDHRVDDDDDLRYLIDTGTIRYSNSFISLEDCLANTSWISLLPQGSIFRSTLRATKDFQDTIVLQPNTSAGSMDRYLRPVQWILSTSRSDLLVVISPFEANKWLPEIRCSQFVSLHLYSPRVTRNAFWSFEGLDSFTVPRRHGWAPNRALIHELNLFASQLFCADELSMKEVCGILGLHLQSVEHRQELQGGIIDPTGFVRDPRAREALGIAACAFESTPLPFFRELFAARRKGQGFALTHMGQILRGNDPKDPESEETDMEPAHAGEGEVPACGLACC
ncbi:hypothetical protein FB451DRAFT_1028934 [Mycena latifolia]|nr:hypothetical protein FB451DRAFT_1028934 [Mycena latifolia]